MGRTDPDSLVAYAEERLTQLGAFSRERVVALSQEDPSRIVALSLAARATSLYQAIRYSLGGPSEPLTKLGTRTLTELSIMFAWLRLNPTVHAHLWAAEDERHRIELMKGIAAHSAGGDPDAEQTATSMAARKTAIEEARAIGLASGVKGVSRIPGNTLLPSLRGRAEQMNTAAVWQAYRILYVYLSAWEHTGASSFDIHLSDDGITAEIREGLPPNVLRDRMLAASVYAFALGEASRWLGLDVEGECDTIRAGLTAGEAESE